MENGDHARLDALSEEVKILRSWRHDKLAPALQKLSSDVDRLLKEMADLKLDQSKTGGMLSHWRDGLITLLAGALLFMLLRFGIPHVGP